jgi:hypothetical protein
MKENAGRTYYSTVQRLKINGLVVDHNGGITTPTVLARFLADVAAGRVVDVQFARYRNKYTEAIYRFLNTKPKGASLAEIMLHLRTVEGFAMASGDYQKSYVLGLLRKLIYQSKSVVKLARGFYKLSAFDKADGSPSPNDDSADTESERPTEGDLLSVGRVH